MILLTDDEIDAAWARSPQNNLRDYAKEIEAAVIRKLATVSVEWPESASSSHEVYLREQIEPMLAAARVQAVEECAELVKQWGALGEQIQTAMRELIGGKDGSADEPRPNH